MPNSGLEKGRTQAGDYAFSIVRNLLYCAYQVPVVAERLSASGDAQARRHRYRQVAERIDLPTCATPPTWTVRFGDMAPKKTMRAPSAPWTPLWPYTNELFEGDAVEQAVADAGIGVRAASFRDDWQAQIAARAG